MTVYYEESLENNMKIIYCFGHYFGILWRGKGGQFFYSFGCYFVLAVFCCIVEAILFSVWSLFVKLRGHLPRLGCFTLSSVCHMDIAAVVGLFIGSLNFALCDVTNCHRHSEVIVCHS